MLTGEGRSNSRWTPEDKSLLQDIPSAALITRVPALDGKGVESRRAALFEAGIRLIREHQPELIFVTLSPFGDAPIAGALSSTSGLPWIADLRDPWALDEFQVFPTRWHRLWERRRMRAALLSATGVIMNTPEAAAQYRAHFANQRQRVTYLTNGYDAEDFKGSVKISRPPEMFTLVHSGYFHAELGLRQRRRRWEYRVLGRTEPGVEFLPRSHYYLIRALEQLHQRRPDIERRLRVLCLGSANSVDRELVDRSKVSHCFSFTGYLPHTECVRRIREASALFLPMHRMPLGRRATIVPGKTYEYMAAGRPILAAVPEGDAKDFLSTHGAGPICPPDDTAAMSFGLESLFDKFQSDVGLTTNNDIERFERANLTKQLVDALESVIASRRVPLQSESKERG